MTRPGPPFSRLSLCSDLRLLRQHVVDFVGLDPAIGVEIHRLVERVTEGSAPEVRTTLQRHLYGLEAAIFGGDDAEIAMRRGTVLRELEGLSIALRAQL